MSVDHFRLVNGFSNVFWGWGGEDDDMSNRLRQKKLYISRSAFAGLGIEIEMMKMNNQLICADVGNLPTMTFFYHENCLGLELGPPGGTGSIE